MTFVPEITVNSLDSAAIVICALEGELSAAIEQQKQNPSEVFFLQRILQTRTLLTMVREQYAQHWDALSADEREKFAPTYVLS